MLLSEGFLQARILSVKVVTLHEKSLELLNKQVGWGGVRFWAGVSVSVRVRVLGFTRAAVEVWSGVA